MARSWRACGRRQGSRRYGVPADAEHGAVDLAALEIVAAVVVGAATVSFVYDGDGRRVKGTVGGVATLYVSPEYEVAGGVVHEATPWAGSGWRCATEGC